MAYGSASRIHLVPAFEQRMPPRREMEKEEEHEVRRLRRKRGEGHGPARSMQRYPVLQSGRVSASRTRHGLYLGLALHGSSSCDELVSTRTRAVTKIEATRHFYAEVYALRHVIPIEAAKTDQEALLGRRASTLLLIVTLDVKDRLSARHLSSSPCGDLPTPYPSDVNAL